MKKTYVVCSVCGKHDKTTPTHVGTSTKMHCDDCGMPKVQCCRECCPSNHGTRYGTWE